MEGGRRRGTISLMYGEAYIVQVKIVIEVKLIHTFARWLIIRPCAIVLTRPLHISNKLVIGLAVVDRTRARSVTSNFHLTILDVIEVGTCDCWSWKKS